MRVRIDMTQGSPLRRILTFAAPLMAGSVLMQATSLLDGLLVGRVAGVKAFAAIASAAPVAFLASGALMGLCAGFLIPIALAVGANDREGANEYAGAALLTTAFLSAVVAIPAAALSGKMIALAGTPPDIAADAARYLRIVLMGLPIPLVMMTLAGILRAEGDTKTPFLFQALGMLLHIALDIVLLIFLKMGVAGAALASLCAHAAASALCFRRVLRGHPDILRRLWRAPSRRVRGRLFAMGVPLGLTSLISSVGAAAFQYAINTRGSDAVAAVAMAERLFALGVMPVMVLGGAAEVFSGQNYGANRVGRIRTGMTRLFLLATGVFWPVTALMAAESGRFLPLLFGGAAVALAPLAGRYLWWCALALPLLVAGSILKNVLQGIGKPGKALIASAYDLLVRLGCALWGVKAFGFAAICAVNPMGWTLSALALAVRCRAEYGRAAPDAPSADEKGRARLFAVARPRWE
jgi:putative MATE family efflux protein